MKSILDAVKERIILAITEALGKAKVEGVIAYESLPGFVVEVPREKGYGDFSTNVAMLLSKQAKMPPRAIAETLISYIDTEGTSIANIELAGPGFINFYLDKAWVYAVLPQIEEQMDDFGSVDIGKGQKVQVEFVSANPTGLLHMGNARGAALGDTMASLLKAAGYEVTREFYVNDAGNQIENFGKSLEARYFQLLGREVAFPEEGYHGQDIIDTVKGYIEKEGERLLEFKSEERKKTLIEYSLQEKLKAIRTTLGKFGVEYDVWFSEQSLHDSGAVTQVIEELREKGYIYEKDGALWFRTSSFGDEKDEVVVRSNGVPTYFAADIAYHKNKFERGFKKIINIWGADHHGHVKRLKGAMQALGYDQEELQVVIMQLVRLFKGGDIVRMSKRSGEMVSLEDLVEEVGRDAARYFFVMRSSDSHLDFDLDLAKSQSSDNPVYYIQYAHARICSILKQVEEKGVLIPTAAECDFSLLKEDSELELIRKLVDFPTEIAESALSLEPHRIARYAHELAGLFHSFYNNNRVMVDDVELEKARLFLVNVTRIVVHRSLILLGLSAPETM